MTYQTMTNDNDALVIQLPRVVVGRSRRQLIDARRTARNRVRGDTISDDVTAVLLAKAADGAGKAVAHDVGDAS